jgi:signal transduction histidine kinase
MSAGNKRRHWWVSWIFAGSVVALSLSLGILQYRWLGEVSLAERDRIRGSLQTSLSRVSQDFNADLTSVCLAIYPDRPVSIAKERHAEYAARFAQTRDTHRHGRMLKAFYLAVPHRDQLKLLELSGLSANPVFRETQWPPEWSRVHERLSARLGADNRGRRGGGPSFGEQADLLELPYIERTMEDGQASFRDAEWLLIQVDLNYITSAAIPQMLQRHLGGASDFQAEVVGRSDQGPLLIYSSDGDTVPSIRENADASVRIFDLRFDQIMRRLGGGPRGPEPDFRGGPGGGPRRPGPPGGDGLGPDRGRWLLAVRHHSGSIDAVVQKARWRNLAVTASILVLMMGAVWALVRYTRRAQRLAELQMEFVAGVSHELRTPLSVMKTAGHNLQGRVANDPARVQRYGALIQEQSEKLTAIVEQVLRFANAEAGRVIGAKEQVSVGSVIDDALAADRQLIEESGCAVQKSVAPDLPPVLGDPTSLKHAIQNLVTNAAKYGKSGDWIGISAEPVAGGTDVEIRVADHGPGIPGEELGQIFEPFYRGKRAIADQVHGTGLGLSLAKRIVEAHHGTIAVRSEEGKGTEFVIRIPAATVEEHEFANSAG